MLPTDKMKNARHSSSFNPESRSAPESQAARPWLEISVYEPLRQRTVQLVKQSVDVLRLASRRISLSTVATKSKEVDPEHRGISESAILDNQEARAYYEQYRSWRGSRQKRAKPPAGGVPAQLPVVKPGRDEQRVRRRYLHMGKEILVERLIATERTLAEQRERWLSQQDEMLTWRLRAEAAENQLQELKKRAIRRKEE